jgi:hypothetical protein
VGFNTYVQKRITFACQSKKTTTSTHVRKREVNSHACCRWYRNAAGMLEGILNHLVCNILEEKAGFVLTNSVGQVLMFQHGKEN